MKREWKATLAAPTALAKAPIRPGITATSPVLSISPASTAASSVHSCSRTRRGKRPSTLGGMDFIKDDHGLSDQPTSPFDDRLQACVDAVGAANAKTGFRSIYVPSIRSSGPHP